MRTVRLATKVSKKFPTSVVNTIRKAMHDSAANTHSEFELVEGPANLHVGDAFIEEVDPDCNTINLYIVTGDK